MLSGINIPISEELILLMSGAVGGICGYGMDFIFHLYVWVFVGCWVSAWEAYWIGRLLGPKLLTLKWFKSIITPQRLEKFGNYIEKFGIFAFIIGRFVPCGVRNTLFMTSGLTKMPFKLFLLRDVGACLLASLTLFYLGHLFGENFQMIVNVFKVYQEVFLVCIVLLVIGLGVYTMRRHLFRFLKA